MENQVKHKTREELIREINQILERATLRELRKILILISGKS